MIQKNIAIFASGSGTNAENIALYFKSNQSIKVSLILSNNPTARVLERAQNLQIPSYVFDRKKLYHSDDVIAILHDYSINLIVLAGFLWLIPNSLVAAYSGKIINIHPALLPKYGGKGMYGDKVHQAVIDHNEMETGISIHYVNEAYDEGDIIFQSKCKIDPTKETISEVAQKVHALEYEHYPKIIEHLLIS